MATAKVKQFWTAFISVLFALFASVGLAAPAAAHGQAPVTQPEEPAAPLARTTGERAATVVAQRQAEPWAPVRRGSLPPTIKQRIGAEAHGSSPASRSLRAATTTPLASDPAALTRLALATAA
ncbi:DUF6344 domain-containing protein [Streptomyces hydrogenans]|uniref:Secreted protein n=1 Tax=Streptomyces hydrogenans TaxID=1873719 RepID=A0ABQ3PGA3_9ACTN|nr:DUF6344 domain-containing protein [Streptomyces hydrogenans]GHF95645.1 hypothetical protein GCM10018784_03970 [Streptomyces hydrogenans]GHI24044.1 hypothetical protein Shyd_54150 [Streptomyces hydrogenans]